MKKLYKLLYLIVLISLIFPVNIYAIDYLKQSTAKTITMGPFLDPGDFFTLENLLTIGQEDVRLKKNDGAYAQKNDTNSGSYQENGDYEIQLNTTDTNTLGDLRVSIYCTVATCGYDASIAWRDFKVLPANVYDSMFSGTDKLDINVAEISGDSTAADNAELDYDGTGYSKSNSTVNTATNITNTVNSDIVSISGDSIAADNLELDYDNTGYTKANSTVGTVTTVANLTTNNDKTGYSLAADQSGVTIGTVTTVTNDVNISASSVDGIWDEPLSGHVTENTAADYVHRVKYGVDTIHSFENHQGQFFFWDPTSGSDSNNGLTRTSAKLTWSGVNALVTAGAHDTVILVNSTGTTLDVDSIVTLNKSTTHLVGPNDGLTTLKPTSDTAPTVAMSADAVHLQGIDVETAITGSQPSIYITADNCVVHAVKINQSRGHGIYVNGGSQNTIRDTIIQDAGNAANDHGILIAGDSDRNKIYSTEVVSCNGSGIRIEGSTATENVISSGDLGTHIHGNTGLGIIEAVSAAGNEIVGPGVEVSENNGGEPNVQISMANTSKVSNVNTVAGYAGGKIYINTNGTNSGQIAYYDGTVDNPVNNIADALALSVKTNLKSFEIISGSSITFAASMDGYVLEGDRWTLALGGQSCSSTTIKGASVSGTCTGATQPYFELCDISTVTLPPSKLDKCCLLSTLTMGSSGTFMLMNCHSAVPGTSAPVIDFGATIGDTGLNMRSYSGGVDFRNVGQSGTGTDAITLEGNGQYILNSNCIGGTLAVRGNFEKTDNSATTTIVENARFDTFQINSAVDSALDTAVPGSPTADSINERIKAIDDKLPTGTISDFDEAANNVLVGDKTGFSLSTAGNDAIWSATTRTLTAGTKDTEIDAIKAKTDGLPNGYEKGVAYPNFSFPMYLSSDHVTYATSLAVSCEVKLDAGSFAACENPVTEVGGGLYTTTISAANMNGDNIVLKFFATGADTQLLTISTQ